MTKHHAYAKIVSVIRTKNMTEQALLEHEQPRSLDEGFDAWQANVDRLTEEIDRYSGTKELPEWWYEERGNSVIDVTKGIKEGQGDHEAVARYYDLYSKERKLVENVFGYESEDHPFGALQDKLGTDVLVSALRSEPIEGPLHAALEDDLREAGTSKHIVVSEMELLRNLYGRETDTELLGLDDDEYAERVRVLLHNENALKWMHHDEKVYDSDATWEKNIIRRQEWMAKAISASAGITQEEARDYAFTASRKGDEKEVLKILQAFEVFGAERIRNLSAKTGIKGLEGYSIKQLERMERFSVDPEEMTRDLADRDVTAVLINRSGDHNGVFTSAADIYEDDDNTLFFEIDSMSDIYKYMSRLHKAGIEPSTLVLAAHSNVGKFMVYDERHPERRRMDIAAVAGTKLVAALAEDGEQPEGRRKTYAIEGLKGFARLVEDYMQPSRGIDDDDSNVGRKKIIFQACHAGSKTELRELDGEGNQTQIGMESVISQISKDLLNSGVTSKIDVYGAPGGIQMHRTEKGVRYSGMPEYSEDGGFERSKLHAERMRIENGKMAEQSIEEIALRK